MSAQALANGSLAIGSNDTDGTGDGGPIVATGADRGTAIGTGASVLAAGVDAIAFGTAATAGGANSIALGKTSAASGGNSIAMGSASTARGVRRTAVGTWSHAAAPDAVAHGNSTEERRGGKE